MESLLLFIISIHIIYVVVPLISFKRISLFKCEFSRFIFIMRFDFDWHTGSHNYFNDVLSHNTISFLSWSVFIIS